MTGNGPLPYLQKTEVMVVDRSYNLENIHEVPGFEAVDESPYILDN